MIIFGMVTSHITPTGSKLVVWRSETNYPLTTELLGRKPQINRAENPFHAEIGQELYIIIWILGTQQRDYSFLKNVPYNASEYREHLRFCTAR